jgi:hypothetical protein
LVEFLTLFYCCNFGATFFGSLQKWLRKIRIIKSCKLQRSSYLSLDQVSSRRQPGGTGISDMRSLFFWHVMQRRLVVALPTFPDNLSVPSSSMKQSKETDGFPELTTTHTA